MNTRIARRLLLGCAAAVVAIVCASAQKETAPDYKPLIGTWKMISETNGDPVNWTLVLKLQDGKLTGFLATEEGQAPAKGFNYSAGVIRFKAPYQGEDYDIELKLNGDKLGGTWSGGGDSGSTSGSKT